MSRIGVAARIDAARRLDFGTNPVVHHLNYFEQPRTAAFIREVLGF
jgi:hypothetical protein